MAITIVDSFGVGRSLLGIRAFNALQMVREDRAAALDQNKVLRRIAELRKNPGGMLFDNSLEWAVYSAHTIRVASARGGSRAEITDRPDETGLIKTLASCIEDVHRGQMLPIAMAILGLTGCKRTAHPNAGQSRLGH